MSGKIINITASTIKNNIVSGTYNEINGKFAADKAINIPFGSQVRIDSGFDLGDNFTLSFWCKIIQDSYNPKYSIAEFINASDDSVWGVWYTPYKQGLLFGNNANYGTDSGNVIYGKHQTWEYLTLRLIHGKAYYYINGQLIGTTDYQNGLQKAKALCIGLRCRNSTFYDDIYIYNMIIDTRQASLDNFNPPQEYITTNKAVYINQNKEVYKAPLEKIADNWDSLSDSQKETLFNGVGYEQATLGELKTLGKFRIATLNKENEKPDWFVGAVPKVQTILPKELLNIKQVEDIDKVTITQNIVSKEITTKKALLHFDGNYKDWYGTIWAVNTTDVAFSSDGKFGKCLEFNGNGAQLLANKDIPLGTSDFTIDFWLKAPSTQSVSYTTIVADRVNNFRLAKDGFTYSGYIGTNWLDEAFDDNWHHVALVRGNGKFVLYIDGVKKQESTNQIGADINIAAIGASPGSYGNTYMKGKIDEFSVVPYAKWTENFTPPTQAYENPPEIKPNDIRFAFTIDKNKYYAFNNNDWEEVQTNEIPTKGNTKETVESIPKEKWKELITAKDTVVVSKLGIAYSIQQRYVDDTCNIDNLTLTINQKGKWGKMAPHTHYMVAFTDNEQVEVTLNNAGSYKINYSLG